jgi:hypothetical protein
MGMLTGFIHVVGFTSFAFAIYYNACVLELPEHIHTRSENYGGPAKYLTFLNMCLQCVFFLVCLLADLTSSKSVKKVKDLMFAGAAFPIGMFVAVIFWGLWAVDRELIFPKKLDGHFPVWLNHFMHTTVLPLQLGELTFSSHKYPSRIVGGGITSLLTLGYLVWIHVVYHYGGFWVYPVFRVLTPTTRPAFMAVCCLMGFVLYLAGEKLNSIIWGENVGKGGRKTQSAVRRKPKKDN